MAQSPIHHLGFPEPVIRPLKPTHPELDLGEGPILVLDGETAPDDWPMFSNNGLLPMGNTPLPSPPAGGLRRVVPGFGQKYPQRTENPPPGRREP
jgi:hypothetical protein